MIICNRSSRPLRQGVLRGARHGRAHIWVIVIVKCNGGALELIADVEVTLIMAVSVVGVACALTSKCQPAFEQDEKAYRSNSRAKKDRKQPESGSPG